MGSCNFRLASRSRSRSRSRRRRSPRRLLAAATTLAYYYYCSSLVIVAAVNKCDSSSSSQQLLFSCPNCGGITVKDCSADCEGYMFADHNHQLCYDRKLFHSNPETGDSDDHYPFLWNDIVGSIVFFLTAGIATACGVGGGGIYVPMGILLLRFPPKPASGLSQASIFGASLGGILVNMRRRHPDEYIRDTRGTPSPDHPGKVLSRERDVVVVMGGGGGPTTAAEMIEADRRRYLLGGDGQRRFYTRPVIDYDMALFLAPAEMAGAVLGVMIQRVFPNWLYLGLAALVLGFTCYKTCRKFQASYRKDRAAARRDDAERAAVAEAEIDAVAEGATTMGSEKVTADDDDDDDDDADDDAAAGFVEMTAMGISGDADDGRGVGRREGDGGNDVDDDPKVLERRRQFLRDDSRQYPTEKIASLLLLWAGLTAITFLKGGKGVDSAIGITCEDAAFYVLVAAQFLWTLGFAAAFGYRNVRSTRERLGVGYPYNETDVLWDARKLGFYSSFTFAAGVVAGLIGIGGGMVLGPLMLVMGIEPRVSTATTATMVLLTSSSVAVMFVMSGLVPWEYALYFFCVCLVGAYVGKTRIDAYVKRTGMASVLVGTLAAIIGLATIGCTVILLMNLAKVDWCLDGFKPFCSVSAEEDKCPARLLMMAAEEMFPY